jgi:chlorophyll synthase
VLIAIFLATQLYLMRRLLENPREKAPWYNATGVSLYVLGMLVAAFALRPALGALP